MKNQQGTFPAVFNLTSLHGTTGFVINGVKPDDHSGSSVSGAGDVNGDGIANIIMSTMPPQYISGKNYIVFGTQEWSELIYLDLMVLMGLLLTASISDLMGVVQLFHITFYENIYKV